MLVADPVMYAIQPGFQIGKDEMDNWQILFGHLRIAPFSDGAYTSHWMEKTLL